MQEVFEKIIDLLQKEYYLDKTELRKVSFNNGISDAIKIVKQAFAEYNNGWIPCSERLPEENGNYIVQIEESDGTAVLYFMDVEHCNSDGTFLHDYAGKKNYRKVIAWQPLPVQYHPKRENCSNRHENGNCLAVGGFCTAVDDKYCKYNKKKTNADRIRSMSDEELAEFMANKGGYIACNQCDFFNHDEEKCESPSGWLCTKGYAEALIHEWLQSEVEE